MRDSCISAFDGPINAASTGWPPTSASDFALSSIEYSVIGKAYLRGCERVPTDRECMQLRLADRVDELDDAVSLTAR